MDIITMEKLKVFFTRHADWCVSLYMPTHRAGRETEQDPIRFKNLLGEIKERLLAKGLRSSDVREVLKPAQSLLRYTGFWQHQSDGLAVFVTSEEFHYYRLPLHFEELVVISKRFHLKPLFPYFTSDGRFYILALSQNQVRLLECTQHTVDEVEIESMPKSLAEAFQYERFEKQLQFHTGTPSGTGIRRAMFHGHDISDEVKGKILRWFQMVDEALTGMLSGQQSPIVLAGVEYLFPIYNEANTYHHLLEQGIPGNPEELKPEELHDRAWTLVRPIFTEKQEKAAAQYSQLAGTGQTTSDVNEAVIAAQRGRVDILFVAVGVQLWGTFDPDTNTVHVHEHAEPGDEDLLNLVAIQSMLNGGAVYAVEPEQIPGHAPLAAVFRY
ncbi:MAG: hypothetical protein RIG61_04215 [Deltaproteobacteria bacterium]